MNIKTTKTTAADPANQLIITASFAADDFDGDATTDDAFAISAVGDANADDDDNEIGLS